nr:uncharacterized protein LOC109778848 isoform X5 [Aegilops tauschii subsp. strangulata]
MRPSLPTRTSLVSAVAAIDDLERVGALVSAAAAVTVAELEPWRSSALLSTAAARPWPSLSISVSDGSCACRSWVLKSHCLFRSSRIRPSCRLLLRRDVARLRNNLPPPPRFISGEALWNPWCCPSRTMVAGLWGIRMDIEKSGSSGWQVLWPRSSSTHPHFRLLTWQLFTEVCCFGLAGMCASMVGPCGLLARMEKHRKVSPLHRLYYSHASYLAMSFCSHRCVHNNSDSAMPDTVSLNKDSFGGLFYHQFPGAKSPNGSALLQSSLEARAVT